MSFGILRACFLWSSLLKYKGYTYRCEVIADEDCRKRNHILVGEDGEEHFMKFTPYKTVSVVDIERYIDLYLHKRPLPGITTMTTSEELEEMWHTVRECDGFGCPTKVALVLQMT